MPLEPQNMSDLEYIDTRSTFGQRRQEWHWQGQFHSINDQAAVIVADGQELMWYSHGLRHRDEHLGPAWIKNGLEIEAYYSYDKLHRENGPAIVGPVRHKWYEHGKCSRRDGPAIINNDGTVEWWFRDARMLNLDQWGEVSGCDLELFVMLKLKYA